MKFAVAARRVIIHRSVDLQIWLQRELKSKIKLTLILNCC